MRYAYYVGCIVLKLIDRIKIEILKIDIALGKSNLRFIDDVNIEYLLHRFFDDTTLLERFIEYKEDNDFQLTTLKVDWSNQELLSILCKHSNLVNYLSEDELFMKCGDEYLFDVILRNMSISSEAMLSMFRRVNNHSLELVDILVRNHLPGFISYFEKNLIDDIKRNKDAIFDKYKDKYYVFETILSLFDDRQEIIDICKKYNRESLLNNIFNNTREARIDEINVDKEKKSETDLQISDESRILLEKFYNVFLNVFLNENNKEYLKIVCDAFRESLAAKNEMALWMLKKLIEIKEKHPEFTIIFEQNKGSYFSQDNHLVSFNIGDFGPSAIFHEFAHAIHYFNGAAIQYDISNAIEELRSDPDRIKKSFEIFKKDYAAQKQIADAIAIKKVDEIIGRSIETYSTDQSSIFERLDIEDKYLKQINKLSISEQLFFDHKRVVMIEQYINLYFENNFPELSSLSDIFDSIFLGNVFSCLRLPGHGIDYFSTHKLCICEIIADFISIKCLPNPEKRLEYLKGILGEELYSVIEQGSYDALGFDDYSKSKKM